MFPSDFLWLWWLSAWEIMWSTRLPAQSLTNCPPSIGSRGGTGRHKHPETFVVVRGWEAWGNMTPVLTTTFVWVGLTSSPTAEWKEEKAPSISLGRPCCMWCYGSANATRLLSNKWLSLCWMVISGVPTVHISSLSAQMSSRGGWWQQQFILME